MTSIRSVTPENYTLYMNDILEIEELSFPCPWNHDAFMEEIDRPISHLWAIIADNTPTGYICFWMFTGEIQVINIAVHPQKRDAGYAQALLKKVVEMGSFNGVHSIWLEVRVSNLIAQGLYESFGFVEVGRRQHYYGDNHEDAIVMSLSLMLKSIAAQS